MTGKAKLLNFGGLFLSLESDLLNIIFYLVFNAFGGKNEEIIFEKAQALTISLQQVCGNLENLSSTGCCNRANTCCYWLVDHSCCKR